MLRVSAEKKLHKTSYIALQLLITENLHVSLGKQMATVWQCFFFGTYSSAQTTERMPGAAGRQRTDFSSCQEDELAVWWGWTLQCDGGFSYLLVNMRRSGWGGLRIHVSCGHGTITPPPLTSPPCNLCKSFLSSIWHHLQTAPHGANGAVNTWDVIGCLLPFT